MNRLLLATLLLAACSQPSTSTTIFNARAIDGDTFVASDVHYRLTFDATSYPDAPEMPGHCRVGRQCAPGDPYHAQDVLQAMLDEGVDCQSFGFDRYGRTLVDCLDHRSGEDIGQRLVVTGNAQVCQHTRYMTRCHS